MTRLSADREKQIESFVHDWLIDADIPGASIAIVDGTDELFAAGFGARNLETNAPATPETLYGVGSITKSVTALAIADLAEQSHLSLSDSVDRYVDHYADAPGDPITIAELLSHTSGMPASGPGLLDQALDGIPAGVADEQDHVRFVSDTTEFRVTDEERFFYYNAGYDVIGRVIEVVDGRQYSEYVDEEIFEPLDMDRSTFDGADFADADDAMTGYRSGEAAPEPVDVPFNELIRPSGGLVSAIRELSRFLRATMTDGTLEGAGVTTPDVIDRCQRGRSVQKTYLDGTDVEYGLGWERHAFLGDELIGHGGSIDVSTAYLGFLEDAQLGVVVACNSSPWPHPGTIGKAVLAIATDNPPTAAPVCALEEKCEAVTGTYQSFRGELSATVEREEGGIEVTLSGPPGEFAFVAFPTSMDRDELTFDTVTRDGGRKQFEFEAGADRMDLFYERFRFVRE